MKNKLIIYYFYFIIICHLLDNYLTFSIIIIYELILNNDNKI